MSRGITVTLLAGLMLTACLTTNSCARHAPDHTWYDANGNAIAENWKTDENGKKLPDPHPYDRYGQPWVYDANGNLVPPEPPPGTTYHHHHYWWWGGSGYRSFGYNPSFRSGSGSSSSSSSNPSSSSISRGGLGSTGLGLSGS